MWVVMVVMWDGDGGHVGVMVVMWVVMVVMWGWWWSCGGDGGHVGVMVVMWG